MIKRCFVFFAVLLISCGAVQAVQRLTFDGGSDEHPNLVKIDEHNFYFVWEDHSSGPGGISLLECNDGIWEMQPVSVKRPSGSHPAGTPDACLDSSGVLHIVYSFGLHTDQSIFYNTYYNGSLGDEERVSADIPWRARSACIVTDGQALYVFWEDERHGDYEIYGRIRGNAGWGPEMRLTDGSGTSQQMCAVVDDCGVVHIVWCDDRDGNFEIYYKALTEGGWTSDKRLTNNSGDSIWPRLALGSENALHVFWQDDTNGVYDIYYKRWTGCYWEEEVNASQSSEDSENPDGSVDTYDIVWGAYWDNTSGTSDLIVKGRDFLFQTWVGETVLSTTATDRATNDTCPSDFMGVHVVWSDYRDGNAEFYYHRHIIPHPDRGDGDQETRVGFDGENNELYQY